MAGMANGGGYSRSVLSSAAGNGYTAKTQSLKPLNSSGGSPSATPVGSAPGMPPVKYNAPSGPRVPNNPNLGPQKSRVQLPPAPSAGANKYGFGMRSNATSGRVDPLGYRNRDANATNGNTEMALRRRYLASRGGK